MDATARESVIQTFLQIRVALNLSLRDLLVALEAVEGYLPRLVAGEYPVTSQSSAENLLTMLVLLWCKQDSSRERDMLRATLSQVVQATTPSTLSNPTVPPKLQMEEPNPDMDEKPSESNRFQQPHVPSSLGNAPISPKQPMEEATPSTAPEPISSTGEKPSQGESSSMGVLPIASNRFPQPQNTAFYGYSPITKRSMDYLWHYLRRPVRDGALTEFDLEGTIQSAVRTAGFTGAVYRRQEHNRAQLIMFLDQMGSMMPFHRYVRDLVATVQTEAVLERLEIYYFGNYPEDVVYGDPYLTEPIALDGVLHTIDSDTSILIVSDAGAARGMFNELRVRRSVRFLRALKEHTHKIAWLNPIPEERWPDSSASLIADFVPMYPMDTEGFTYTVSTLNGSTL